MSVAMPGTGQIAAVASTPTAPGSSPTASVRRRDTARPTVHGGVTRALTASEWHDLLPHEPYDPACSSPTASAAWSIDASPGPAQALVARVRSTARMPDRPPTARPNEPSGTAVARRSRYIRSDPKSFAAGDVPHVVARERMPVGQLERGRER